MTIDFIFNPFTKKLDAVSIEDLSGYVPYTGATQALDLNNQNFEGVGNLRLYDSAGAADGLLYLEDSTYKFLSTSESPATIQAGEFQIYDVSSSVFKKISVWDSIFIFQDESSNYCPIFTGNHLFYDPANAGTGFIEHIDNEFRFYGFMSEKAGVIGGWANFTSDVAALSATLGSTAAPGNYFTLRSGANSRVTIGDFGFGLNFVGVSFANTPATSNYSLLGDNSNTYLNSPLGGTIYLRAGNNNLGSYTATEQVSNVPTRVLSATPNLVLESTGSNSVNAGKIQFRTSGGAENCTLTFDASANQFKLQYGTNTNLALTATSNTFNIPSSATGGVIVLGLTANTWTNSSLVQKLVNASVVINQSGTAGFDFIDVTFTQTTTGSGEKNLIRFSKTGTDVFKVDYLANTTWLDGATFIFGSTTGTKLGTATTQKLAFWNKTPIVQPTTTITTSAFVANTGIAVNDASTFGGYTIGKVVAALIAMGILA